MHLFDHPVSPPISQTAPFANPNIFPTKPNSPQAAIAAQTTANSHQRYPTPIYTFPRISTPSSRYFKKPHLIHNTLSLIKHLDRDSSPPALKSRIFYKEVYRESGPTALYMRIHSRYQTLDINPNNQDSTLLASDNTDHNKHSVKSAASHK